MEAERVVHKGMSVMRTHRTTVNSITESEGGGEDRGGGREREMERNEEGGLRSKGRMESGGDSRKKNGDREEGRKGG